MCKLIKRLLSWFKRRHCKDVDSSDIGTSITTSVYETDLLLTDCELKEAIAGRQYFRVRIDAGSDFRDKAMLYRNLVRLVNAYHIDKANFSFVIAGNYNNAEITAEQLRRMGFANITMPDRPKPIEAKNTDDIIEEYYVAGLKYNIGDDEVEVWKSLRPGVEVEIHLEPDNRHDCNAVRLECRCPQLRKLGYIPRDRNKTIATLLRNGHGDMLCSRITAINESGNTYEKIKIATYIRRR